MVVGARRCMASTFPETNEWERSPPATRLGGLFSRKTRYGRITTRSEEHTSELQSLMRISYAVFCLKKKKTKRAQEKEKYTTRERYKKYNTNTRDNSTNKEVTNRHIR